MKHSGTAKNIGRSETFAKSRARQFKINKWAYLYHEKHITGKDRFLTYFQQICIEISG